MGCQPSPPSLDSYDSECYDMVSGSGVAGISMYMYLVSVSVFASGTAANGLRAPTRVCSCVISSDLKLGVGFEAADGR